MARKMLTMFTVLEPPPPSRTLRTPTNHRATRPLYRAKLCPNSLLDVNIILFISILHNNSVTILNCSPLRFTHLLILTDLLILFLFTQFCLILKAKVLRK